MKIILNIIGYFIRIINLLALFIYFCYKIINSGWEVGLMVLRGYRGEKEGIVQYQLQSDNPWQILLLFNLISMTPGSLSTDISDDHRIIFVHLLNTEDTEDFYKTTENIEKMLIRSFSKRILLF